MPANANSEVNLPSSSLNSPTKLQFSKAELGKDYWLKVSKQKKAKRQGVEAPAFPSSPSDGYADNSKVLVCPY